MSKFAFAFVAAAIAAMFVGCASVEVAKKADFNGQLPDDAYHINAQNWGLYFLSWPLFTGSADSIGKISVLDEDSVNVPATVKILTTEAKKLGADKVEDLSSQRSSMMIPIPFPFLFYMKETNVSGTAR